MILNIQEHTVVLMEAPLAKDIFNLTFWDQCGHGQETVLKYPEEWESLRQKVIKTGIRNSLLLAPMPTASTSQILGNNECFEPFTSNMYLRRTIAGEFVFINKYLLQDLIQRGLWNPEMKDLTTCE